MPLPAYADSEADRERVEIALMIERINPPDARLIC